MKKILIIVASGLFLLLGGCAVKDQSPNAFKNYTAKQILAAGEKALAKKDYSDAIKYFEAIDALYPFDSEAHQGQLDVIYAYYRTEDYPSALAAANRYIHLYPEGKYTDYAYYMKGLANFDKERSALHKVYPRKVENLDIANLREAFLAFSDLLKNFPHSIYAGDAKKKMFYIRNLLAQHELNIAQFYFKRKAYPAAINRARDIVKHFAGARQVKEALKIMIYSYRALGVERPAADALRIWQLNFPKETI